MKSIGLGTPATRAGIIEKLISVGYIKRNKKNLVPTQNGIQLIEIVHEKLKKPDLTGEWESQLGKISKKEVASRDFIVDIKKYVAEIVREGKITSAANVNFQQEVRKGGVEAVGVCPRCGREILEGKKKFFCAGYKNYPSCNFSLWKEDKTLIEKGIVLTRKNASELLKDRQTEAVAKINESEKEITIKLTDNGYRTSYKIE